LGEPSVAAAANQVFERERMVTFEWLIWLRLSRYGESSGCLSFRVREEGWVFVGCYSEGRGQDGDLISCWRLVAITAYWAAFLLGGVGAWLDAPVPLPKEHEGSSASRGTSRDDRVSSGRCL
jgi:hypothetical protein